ncbi:hypothetical protein Cni_G09926 [Canna indica]|uniref:Uncharacterized protein n=1 Tax=Canna indica TaxID=4628 RepID=A0AAQ3K3I3_9LILI|nr:hypothetical protein Cni_G09926 [Canna indica]
MKYSTISVQRSKENIELGALSLRLASLGQSPGISSEASARRPTFCHPKAEEPRRDEGRQKGGLWFLEPQPQGVHHLRGRQS